MKNLLPYVGQFALVVAAVLVAGMIQQQMNKPKTIAPPPAK